MIYSVIVDVSNSAVDKVFDYSGENYVTGQRVYVDFAGRKTEGFVVDVKNSTDVAPEKLKSIISAADSFPALIPEMPHLASVMREKYHLRLIDVLRLFVPSEMRKNRVKTRTQKFARARFCIEEMLAAIKPNAVKQTELAKFLACKEEFPVSELNAEFSPSAVKALTEKGFLEITEKSVRRVPYAKFGEENARHVLTQAQKNAVDEIINASGEKFLIRGVTGSGKTEIYMTVIEHICAQGKSCIMLVPEISLTPNMLRLFRSRFGENVALLHSGLSAGERYDEWLRLRRGEAKIAIGARSAIFAPLTDIGAIIIDEEHDPSYVSDSNPRYDTREVAVMRLSFNVGATIVLGSATPSLETYYAAKRGAYKLIELPDRINRRPLPEVETADMAAETRAGNKDVFSALLTKRLKETLEKGNQAILFLNRRGSNSFLMCSKCGYVAKCTDCDVSLTVHEDTGLLKCHYCGKSFRMLNVCPECKSSSFRRGKIGTEQVVKKLAALFPDVKILRMDADTTRDKESHGRILSAFRDREAQILVGTQMIAKGHDFPYVTLVGILDGDQSLYYSDYRSAERTFQLVTQVAGRSGRDAESGKVVLQTYTPRHYCLQFAAKQDYVGFYEKEINLREASSFPPFSVIIKMLYTGEDEKLLIEQVTEHFGKVAALREQRPDDFFYLDKMRCRLKRAENKFRFQILMKVATSAETEIARKLYEISDSHKKGVFVFVAVNPESVM